MADTAPQTPSPAPAPGPVVFSAPKTMLRMGPVSMPKTQIDALLTALAPFVQLPAEVNPSQLRVINLQIKQSGDGAISASYQVG